MRILVVEDEQKTADYLQQGLTESGYVSIAPPAASTACTWPGSTPTNW